MSNLHNMLAVVIEITSYLHHVTPTKYENRETIETKDTCFWEERFIDRSFLLLEILKAEILCPPPPPPRPPPPPHADVHQETSKNQRAATLKNHFE